MPNDYSALLEPLELRGRRLLNRVVFLPTTNNLVKDHMPTAAQAAFYRERAKGGVGLIVSEGLRVHRTNAGPGSVPTFKREVLPGLTRIGDEVHEFGSTLVAQLLHGGRQHHAHSPRLLWAPSAIACNYSGYVPHAMTTEEVEEMRDSFITGAMLVQEAGWDGVELHASHGHLVQEFLSPLSNQRNDRYGGDFERRLTFALECLLGIRARCGEDFIIGFRLAATEFVQGGLNLELSLPIAQAVEERTTIDYISISQANFLSIYTHIPDRHTPPHPYVGNCAQIRAALKRVPVVAATRIRTPDEAEALLENGTADMIGLCRPLICDPYWTQKAQNGLANEIRRCIYCNVCWQSVVDGAPIACAHNPQAGRELQLGDIVPATIKQRVAIIGGGPAGLAAAEAAALRGHRVVLFEGREHLGGQVAMASQMPGEEEYSGVIDYLEGRLDRLGVEVRLETHADEEAIQQLKPDTVVVATGSFPDRENFPDTGKIKIYSVLEAWMVCELGSGPPLKKVVLLDEHGHFITFTIAEYLAKRHIQVIFVTRQLSVGRDIPPATLTELVKCLHTDGAEFLPGFWIDRTVDGAVILRHVYSARETRIDGVDAVVVAGGNKADDRLYHALRASSVVPAVCIVGDAVAPRSIKDAVYEGHMAGRVI